LKSESARAGRGGKDKASIGLKTGATKERNHSGEAPLSARIEVFISLEEVGVVIWNCKQAITYFKAKIIV